MKPLLYGRGSLGNEVNMNHFLHGVAKAVSEAFPLPEPILEIGSYQVAGQEGINNLRSLFAGREYIGVDMRAGPGVDRVANVEALPFADGSIGTIIALSTFEHVRCFWRGFDEVHRVLQPQGAFLVAVPFYFHIHAYPSDYWRFTPEALDGLLELYPQRVLGWHGPPKRPANVWTLALREKYPTLAPHQMEHYRRLLSRYAKEPASWKRQVRYWAGSLFFGRGPFASFLDRQRWETEWRQRA